jgi:hypothetical protein
MIYLGNQIMKKSQIQKHDRRGGRREGAGRPRVPRVTAPLTPELEAALHAQAQAAGRTPEAHAAHLIAQGLSVLPATPQPAQVQASPAAPPPRPPGLRQLVPGPVAASAPHHRKLIDDLEDGATLKEQARDVWHLSTPGGEARRVDSRTVFSLLSKKVLEE